jgi:hypothetical protein
MSVGYFMISEIMKQKSERTGTVAPCIHMSLGYFLVRPNARGKNASTLNK